MELKSKDEYESCDIGNPIRMYTDGLDSVSLDREGIRYFASSKPESCKNGLKLHIDVQPHLEPQVPKVATSESEGTVWATAAGPTSAASHLIGSFIVLGFGFLCYVVGV